MGSFVYYRSGSEGRSSGLNTGEARRVLSLLPGQLLVEVCLRPVVDASMRQGRFHIENGQEPALTGIAAKETLQQDKGPPLTVSGLLQALDGAPDAPVTLTWFGPLHAIRLTRYEGTPLVELDHDGAVFEWEARHDLATGAPPPPPATTAAG